MTRLLTAAIVLVLSSNTIAAPTSYSFKFNSGNLHSVTGNQQTAEFHSPRLTHSVVGERIDLLLLQTLCQNQWPTECRTASPGLVTMTGQFIYDPEQINGSITTAGEPPAHVHEDLHHLWDTNEIRQYPNVFKNFTGALNDQSNITGGYSEAVYIDNFPVYYSWPSLDHQHGDIQALSYHAPENVDAKHIIGQYSIDIVQFYFHLDVGNLEVADGELLNAIPSSATMEFILTAEDGTSEFMRFHNVEVTQVPIPAGIYLFGSALLCLGYFKRTPQKSI